MDVQLQSALRHAASALENASQRLDKLSPSQRVAAGIAGAGLSVLAARSLYNYIADDVPAAGYNDANIMLSDIIVYPVKGLRGVHVKECELDDRGLHGDRRWMLVELDDDEDGGQADKTPLAVPGYSPRLGLFQSQRSLSRMATLQPSVLYRQAGSEAGAEDREGAKGSEPSPVPTRVAQVPTALRLSIDRTVNGLAPEGPSSCTAPVVSAADVLSTSRAGGAGGGAAGAGASKDSQALPAGACIRPVRVWRSTFRAVDQGDAVSAWLTSVLLSPQEQAGQPGDGGDCSNGVGAPQDTRHADAPVGSAKPGRSIRLVYLDPLYPPSVRPTNTKWLPLTGGWPAATGLTGLMGTVLAPLWRAVGMHAESLAVPGRRYPLLLSLAQGLWSGRYLSTATSFADGYPLLLASESSLADLNRRISDRRAEQGLRPVNGDRDLPMARFRPNLVVAQGPAVEGNGTAPQANRGATSQLVPWAEDTWRRVRIDGHTDDGQASAPVVLQGVKRCDRCLVTTTDQTSGHRRTGDAQAHEPLATMATFRASIDGPSEGLFFAINCVQELPWTHLWAAVRAGVSTWWTGLSGSNGKDQPQPLATGLVLKVGDRLTVLSTGPMGPF